MNTALFVLAALVVAAVVAPPPPKEPKLTCSLECTSGDICFGQPAASCQLDCWRIKVPGIPKKNQLIECLEQWYLPDGEKTFCSQGFF